MAKLNKEALEEIVLLHTEVKDVVRLLNEFGIKITSDPWTAISHHDDENILSWKKEDFQKINDLNEGDRFFVGGNILTGGEHEYKNEWIIAPRELAEIQADIFEKYLKQIENSLSLKHFDTKVTNEFGLTNNCGWENFFSIDAKIRKSGLIEQQDYFKNLLIELIEKELITTSMGKNEDEKSFGYLKIKAKYPEIIDKIIESIDDKKSIYEKVNSIIIILYRKDFILETLEKKTIDNEELSYWFDIRIDKYHPVAKFINEQEDYEYIRYASFDHAFEIKNLKYEKILQDKEKKEYKEAIEFLNTL